MRMVLADWGYNIHRTTTGDAGLIGIVFVQTTIGAPGE